jgi:hypothetical protein
VHLKPQEALKHIHPPADAAAAAADAAEDARLAAGARLSPKQKRVLVDLREAIYTNLGRCPARPCVPCSGHPVSPRVQHTACEARTSAATSSRPLRCRQAALAKWWLCVLSSSVLDRVCGMEMGRILSGSQAVCTMNQDSVHSTHECLQAAAAALSFDSRAAGAHTELL